MSCEDVAGRRVVVGRISGIFGVRGWVRVFSYTDPPEAILGYGPWMIGDEHARCCRVLAGATHGRGVIAHLAGVDDRDLARALIGSTIRVAREAFPGLAEGEYYWDDLLGLEVVNTDGIVLGRVEDLMETGANDVLVLRGEQRRLVPFIVGSVVRSVDLAASRITVEWSADD